MLSKIDVAALRQADDICIHLNATHPNGLMRAIKHKKTTEKDPFAQDVEYQIVGHVTTEYNAGQASIKTGEAKCFAMLRLYRDSERCHVWSIIKRLRAGDELTWRFWADAHTNQYMERAGLHGDALYLDVRREGRRIDTWLVDTSHCPDNSARMCQGLVKASQAA